MDIREIKDKEEFVGMLLVRDAVLRTAQNGKCFLDLALSDKSGTISAKVWEWEQAKEPPTAGSIIKVAGTGNEFNGKIQLKVDRMRETTPADGVSLSDFVPSSPEDPRAMLNEVLETVAAIQDESIRNITGELVNEACVGEKLLSFPAAKMLHHAERGGLLHHMTGMLRTAKAILGVYPYLNSDLLLAGIVIHDLSKLKEMETDVTGLVSGYSTEGRMIGHIVRGAMDIERVAAKVGADPSKAMLLQHMVLSHHGKLEFGSPVLPKIPEAEVLSLIDVLDARLFQMREALEGVEDGGFSSKIWAFDNREIYKVPGDSTSSL